jgi:nitric-oxide synthase, bacterial
MIQNDVSSECNRLPAADLETFARIAWRNNARCIGRLFWKQLRLLDARDATSPTEVFEACVEHLNYSTNGGKIRPTITVFAQQQQGNSIRIYNKQLIRYAGYTLPGGAILGDPEQVAFTRWAMELGWQPPPSRSPFDLLPLLIETPNHSLQSFEIPKMAVMEVPLTHPDFPWFRDLNLKWHALPAVSNMALEIGSQRYTAAPFSGFYMSTEIGCRNLGDPHRYNMLPVVARHMGLDMSHESTLWRDRAMLELNCAVIHSFRSAHITLVDHHTASTQFLKHLENEREFGRKVPGDWSWLVPPMSASACPVFHRYYDGPVKGPAFVEQC